MVPRRRREVGARPLDLTAPGTVTGRCSTRTSGPGTITSMSPLWGRALRRAWSGGTSGVLQVVVLTVLALTAAAGPLFAEAADNASLARTLDAVPVTAQARDAPVVRLNGGSAPTSVRQRTLLDQLDDVEGAGPPAVLAFSVAQELVPRSVQAPVVVAGDREARARLAAVDDPASALDVVAQVDDPVEGGVWLSEEVATALAVAPGDRVELALDTLEGRGDTARVTLAGTYRADDRRRPIDPPGRELWFGRRAGLPQDTSFTTLPAHLVVTDLASAERYAERVGDVLFWTAEVRLDPPRPTLAEARRTAADVERLRRTAVDPREVDIDDGPLRLGVASGVEDLVGDAGALAEDVRASTRTVSTGGVLVGLAAVLVAVGLTLRLRAGELRAMAGVGLAPGSVAAVGVVEVLAPAVVGAGLGTLVAWGLVVAVGPPGDVTSAALAPTLRAVVLAQLAALALVALATALAAALAGRATRPGARTRRVPWRAVLVVLAASAVAGVATRPLGASSLGALDLLVPLLVAAATGAVGATLLGSLVSRLAARRPDGHGALGARGPRHAATTLALRRAAAPGDERAVVVTVVTAGLAVLLWALTSVASVRDVVEDRVAVATGAAAVAELRGSWDLVADAPSQLTDEQVQDRTIEIEDLPPGLGSPELPPGQTVVWHAQTSVPGRSGGVDVLLVDADSFGAAASWGATGAVAGLREHLPAMAEAEARIGEQMRAGERWDPLPVVVVGDLGLDAGSTASVATDLGGAVVVRVLDVVEAAPGRRSGRPRIIAPADPFLLQHLNNDPRLRPSTRAWTARRDQFRAELWTSGGAADLDRSLAAAGAEPIEIRTVQEARARPVFVAAGLSRSYQLAIGVLLALLAAAALALHADRAAARHRPTDVLLARAGLGRRGTALARDLEVLVLGATSGLLAVVAVLLVSPLADRLLDPGDGELPAARLVVGPTAVLVALVAVVATTLLAAGAARARARAGSDAEVLRDA